MFKNKYPYHDKRTENNAFSLNKYTTILYRNIYITLQTLKFNKARLLKLLKINPSVNKKGGSCFNPYQTKWHLNVYAIFDFH